MRNVPYRLIFVIAFTFLCAMSNFAQDLKVFDLELAKPLALSECPYAVNTGKAGPGVCAKKMHMYAYLKLPVNQTCFKRVKNRFFEQPISTSTPLPTLPPPTGTEIKIAYPAATRPGLLAAEAYPEIDGEVDENGNLVRILFYTDEAKSKDVLQVLLQKYGKTSSAKDYEAHLQYGTIREFSIFAWELPQLKVTYRTLINGTSILSTWGTVEIIHQPKKVAPKDKNPL